ncbi:MAG: hypothetical protein ACQEQE_02585 [Bacillota bacterium]
MDHLSKLLEIEKYDKDGYKPIVDYDKWRVAILNYHKELLVKNIDKMQKHNETDEVFVLLKGKCTLFLANGDKEIGKIYKKDMKPFKAYNIKKGVWHTHTLSKEAKVLIVENRDTSLKNSPEKKLKESERKKLINLVESS